ncbi:MAG TPA: LL-diaminopimelate aminotransferase [Parachlamydiaceae bacterium]|nr:LL-diaminopimelate aminotransferase [Parachlamydiaceae bacterium]
MVKRNPNIAKLNAGYLFPEIHRRRMAFLKKNPDAKIISLGIGDTTEAISPHIANGLMQFSKDLGTPSGYSGYGAEQGNLELRQKIRERFYNLAVDTDEIFISDGAKCDIGRLQTLFGNHCKMSVQDPSYPAYVDTGVISGQTGFYNIDLNQYEGIEYLKCTPENHFFPKSLKPTDLIYFCSPNNPTGAVATKEQLQKLVDFAKKNRSIIIFDAAYAPYLQDEKLPKSIYEIPGAKEVAIELGSFSKIAGFTGVRLGWSVVPEALEYEDGTKVKKDWNRLISTFFNGASNIAMHGGLAALSDEGFLEMRKMMDFYLENARLIKETLVKLGIEVHGGQIPYIWAKFPNRNSWDVFEYLLEKAHLVCTPGSGFGPAGEGFVRFSAYGKRENIIEACKRLKEHLGFFTREQEKEKTLPTFLK